MNDNKQKGEYSQDLTFFLILFTCYFFIILFEVQRAFVYNSRVLLVRQIWIVNFYVKCSSHNLSNENKNTGVSREVIYQK